MFHWAPVGYWWRVNAWESCANAYWISTRGPGDPAAKVDSLRSLQMPSRVRARRVRANPPAVLSIVGALAWVSVGALTVSASATPVPSDAMPYFSDGSAAEPLSARTAPTKQSLVTTNSGTVVGVPSFGGSGDAGDYPQYSGAANGPRAVVSMVNTTDTDEMTPLAKRFFFGADINSDAVSTGTKYDNGNNIFQRGLYGDRAQYKLQIDHGYAMCRVKGDKGSIALTSKFLMPAGEWFRVRCYRLVHSTGNQLWLEIAPINQDGSLGPVVRSKSGIKWIGRLAFTFDTPVSIGGKLISATQIHAQPDQFNGLIDNPVLDVD